MTTPAGMTIYLELDDSSRQFPLRNNIVIPTGAYRISCHGALETVACAPFRKERRMKFARATKFHRKSGVA
jgi:hypothetical protein